MFEDFIIETPVGEWRVLGLPRAQPRPRAFVRGGRAAVYDCGTAEGWKSDVARACWEIEGRCLFGALGVRLTFYMPRPKSHYRANGFLKTSAPMIIHNQKPDVDNLAKAVLDAMTGIQAWRDDAQVCELTVSRRWEIPGKESPGCLIRINGWEERGW